MKAYHRQRLLKLAAFLEELPRKRFDYDQWVGFSWKGNPALSCGTTACAMGWATTIPAFRRLGLRLSDDGYPINVRTGETFAVSVAADLFGVDDSDAHFLFVPASFKERRATPKQVARKIRRFVAHGGRTEP